MDISVVVPTCGRPRLLGRCLGCLAGQSLGRHRYEIIIVDDASSAQTRDQVRLWSRLHPEGPSFRYLNTQERSGPAAARNMGWRAATAPIIAFTDDDTQPDHLWLEQGLKAFDDPAVLAASGRVIVPLPPEPTDYEYNEAGLAKAAFVTANCFVQKSVLQLLGGFNERFKMAWREDSDLHFRLEQQAGETGRRLAHAELAVVVHPVRPAKWGISLRQQRKSQYNALLYKLHPRRYRSDIQSAPPWRYYGMVFAGLGTVTAWLAERPTTAVLALATLAVLTLEFCVRRLRHTSHSASHVVEMLVTSLVIPFLSVFWRLVGAFRFRTLFF